MENSSEKRDEFIKNLSSYSQNNIYYIDECGIDKYLYREYAYSPRGVKVAGKISGKKYKRTNIVAAKCCDKIIAPMIYEGSTDSVLFEYWFEKELLTSVPKHSVFVLDNASFHRKVRLSVMTDVAECDILFLPP